MMPPTSQKWVHQFIGLVNYNCNTWKRHWHKVVPLTKITSSKVKFELTKIEQNAFKEIKRIADRDILSAYPYFNEYFITITNARDFQLWEVIIRNSKLINFYSRNLTGLPNEVYSNRKGTIKHNWNIKII